MERKFHHIWIYPCVYICHGDGVESSMKQRNIIWRISLATFRHTWKAKVHNVWNHLTHHFIWINLFTICWFTLGKLHNFDIRNQFNPAVASFIRYSVAKMCIFNILKFLNNVVSCFRQAPLFSRAHMASLISNFTLACSCHSHPDGNGEEVFNFCDDVTHWRRHDASTTTATLSLFRHQTHIFKLYDHSSSHSTSFSSTFFIT